MIDFDAFISYPHQSKAQADAACGALERAGVRCWIAPRDVEPGAEWASAIVEAIDHCRVMILIFSSHANQSKQIRREVQRAFDREVPVVPFRIENVMPEKSLAYFMGPVHWLDALTPPFEHHLQKLVSSVTALVRAKPTTASDGPSVKDADRTQAVLMEAAPTSMLASPSAGLLDQTMRTAPIAVKPEPETVRPNLAGSTAAGRADSSAPWALLDCAGCIFLWAGTLLLAWWLLAASTGPARFGEIGWLTGNPIGLLIMACYCLAILLQSLRRILALVRSSRFGLTRSVGAQLSYEDYAIVANAPLVIALAALLVEVWDRNHAAVAQILSWPFVAVPMLLFAVTVAVQMKVWLQSIVYRHLRDDAVRPIIVMAITLPAIVIAATMAYAIIRINVL
jgi:succinate dehydrogenase hydrophobic anchor subunit